MGEIEDENEFFCPRLRWAKENAEPLGWLKDLWKRYRLQKEILHFMQGRSVRRNDILEHFQITESRWRSFMNEFGHRGVKIKTLKKYKEELRYLLETEPKAYKFSQRLNYWRS